MLRAVTATVLSGVLLGGCGATWPNRAAALATPRVHQVTTVDVLPVDLEVWTENGYPQPPEDVRDGASTRLMAGAVDLLQKNGYAIDGLIDWNGEIDGRGAVLAQGDLEQTIATLARYDLKTGQLPLRLPDPQLPAKLGASGADATLYIGGWAYVAAHHDSTGEKVAEGILIGVAIIAVVAIVAIALSSKGDSHGGGSHGGGGGSHGGGGGGHSSPTFHDHRGGVAAADHPSFVTVGTASIRDHRGSAPAMHVSGGHSVHVDTAIDIIDSIDPQTVQHPDWSGDVPASGEDSQMYVEMTLVDNATGTVLWHAHQKFPANAASQDDVARVARTLIASLPAH